MNEIGIGLLGFGTVGSGVVEGLRRNADLITARLGVRPVLRKIADIDIDSDRGVEVDPAVLTTDAESVIADPSIQVIVELIGGTDAAKELVIKAIEAGKPVVTANKALLAEHGKEIFALAAQRGVSVYFGASVGGGIPIVRALREGMVANRIESIHGILNGTCNFILTRMEDESLPFEKALEEAQQAGFAEADPRLDLDGTDTAHKAVILASLAYGSMVPMESVHVEGIQGLSYTDIQYALDLGYRIKLLAVIKRTDGGAQVRVHPTLVPLGHVLASVSGVFNAVMVRGNMAGDILYYGRGAGREPTASTVIGDVADVVRDRVGACPRRFPVIGQAGQEIEMGEIGEVETRHYLRLSLLDRPGVFAEIASILGKHKISIASVLQKEVRLGEYVPVVIVTHYAKERALGIALEQIGALDIVGAATVRLRIEE